MWLVLFAVDLPTVKIVSQDNATYCFLIINSKIYSTMGSIRSGFLDGFSGRLGNVIGYEWRGRMCVRSMPSQYRDARTPGQMQQRSLFKEVVRFASRAKRVLKVGLKTVSIDAQMTESNYFMRINKGCFVLQAGAQASSLQNELSIDYENLILADGPVAPVAFGVPQIVDETTISVDFEKNPLRRVAHPDDLVYVAAYCPELGDFDLSAPVYRRSNRLTMSLNGYWAGREVHLWGFVVDGAGRASLSQYLGCTSALADRAEEVDFPLLDSDADALLSDGYSCSSDSLPTLSVSVDVVSPSSDPPS